jgi:hypothetical protein
MSGANPIDPKAEAPKAAATALAAPTAPPAAKSRPWSRLRLKQKFWLLTCGSGLAIAAGAYGYKYFTAVPGAAVAQTETAAVAAPATKPADPGKLPGSVIGDDLPTVAVPPIHRVKNEEPDTAFDVKPPDKVRPAKPAADGDDDILKIKVPDTVRPAKPVTDGDDEFLKIKAPGKDNKKSETETDSDLLIVPPPIPGKSPHTSKPDEAPSLIDQPNPDADSRDAKKKKPEKDLFIASEPVPTVEKKTTGPKLGPSPSPLPTEVTEKSEKATPVIRIGGTDTPPPPKPGEPPPVPKLEVDVPDLPPTPPADKKIENKPDPVPPVIKVPMLEETPPPPTIKSPMIPDVAPPVAKTPADKKENYDEDWHTYRDGDTYVSICQEYFHDMKYAKALEAYNKDRRKPGDKIVFVPPTFVLEERFGNLIQTTDRPARPDVRTAGDLKFEPVAPPSRPAPSSASGNEEYKVTAETGETIREIARKVYRDEESWKKIWEMNPSIDPTRPIPSGTTLRLGR